MDQCKTDVLVLLTEGAWERGLKHGHGVLVHSTGETYTGSWRHGEKHGEGVMEGKKFTVSGRDLLCAVWECAEVCER